MYNSQWTCGNLMEMIHLFYVYRYVYQYLLSSTPVYLKNKFDVKSSHNTKFYFSNKHLWKDAAFNWILSGSFITVET